MLEFRNHALGNPVRLSIMIYLLPRERALFKELHEILEITPGNLNSHLKRLEKEGYVRIKKVIADRPRTAVEITLKGAEETGKYNVLEPTTTAINLARLRWEKRSPSPPSIQNPNSRTKEEGDAAKGELAKRVCRVYVLRTCGC